VVVLGNGQLALAMLDTLRMAKVPNVYHLHRPMFDITYPACMSRIPLDAGVLINCIAYNDVDKAEDEDEQDEAMRVNCHGMNDLVRICRIRAARLVHVSTDFVFDGMSRFPYHEQDRPNPLSVYGSSKWQGEEVVRSKLPDDQYLIVRTSSLWTDAKGRRENFPYKIMYRTLDGQKSDVISGRVMCPTYAPHLADAILALINECAGGTFHVVNTGMPLSWYDFAVEFCKAHDVPKVDELIKPADNWDAPAERPAYSALSCDKFVAAAGRQMPTRQQSIREAVGHG
jgi:dTDP-4-dehydrorhamnose reductase